MRVARTVVPGLEITAWRHQAALHAPPEGVERCVESFEEALSFAPQAAVIANPATHHLAAAHALANEGVHILVEKPIAASALGVEELTELCDRKGVTLMTGYNLRFLPSLVRFRELLQEGAVGRVLSVRAEVGQCLPSWRPGTDYRQTVSARAALGGGVLLELSHEFDYLRWLFGEVEWVQAVVLRQSGLQIDVEDTVHVVLGFVPLDGATPVVAALNMDFTRHDTTRTCTVIGTDGTLRWNGVTGSVERFGAGAALWETIAEIPGERDASYLAEWHHFTECIETGTPPLISGRDGLAAVLLVDAARASAAGGKVVRLAPLPGSATPMADE